MTQFSQKALDWFAGLEADNSKAYFEANRDFFEQEIRQPLTGLLDAVAEAQGGTTKIFRQNRDIRFSKDKSPYKTNTYGVVRPEEGHSGFYISISATGLYAGGGYYDLERDQLGRFRDAIVEETSGSVAQEVANQLVAQGFEIWAEDLKTVPRGYPKDHPRISLLRRKRWVAGRAFDHSSLVAGKDMTSQALELFDALKPLGQWLDQNVGPSETPPEARFGRKS